MGAYIFSRFNVSANTNMFTYKVMVHILSSQENQTDVCMFQ